MKKTRNLLLASLLFAGSAAVAQDPPAAPKAATPPPPPASERKIKNFDDVQVELDRVQKQLEELQQRGLPEPPAVPDIDFAETERALARASRELRRVEIPRAQMTLARRQMEQARREMVRVQADMPRLQAEVRRSQEGARRSLAEARVNVARAREESKEYKTFEDELVSAGLISRDSYQLEHRDGKFFINGKEQPAAIYQKYRSFLDKHKKFRWTKSEQSLNINSNYD